MRKAILIFGDILILYSALWITLLFRYGERLQEQLGFHLLPFSILFIIWLFIFYTANLYEIFHLKNASEFFGSFFKTIALNAVIGIAFFYLLPFWTIAPRRNLFLFLLIFSLADFLFRILFNRTIASQRFKNHTLIIGLNRQSAQLAKFLKENPQIGYQLECILDTSEKSGSDEFAELEIIRNINQLRERVEQREINTIIISPEAYKIPRMIEILYQLLQKKINFYPLSGFYEKIAHKILLDNLDQLWFLENLSEGGRKMYESGKRISDIFFSLLFGAFALALSPLIALAIKMNSKGPILFKQTRIGQLGKKFEIIKFRTMIVNAEEKTGAVWAQENDPRVTKVGRFLRRTRLDELPQLWNILKGEMSFVGPRAERPEFHEQLKNGVPFYEERYLIKPGLTGWAQIQYRYGSSVKDAAEKLQYDLFYIKHRSLALDFSITLKTANIVVRQAGR
ncbi:MAG: sugar transferase [Candidatus Yanofskybacteria bacterium]|nr:sugar transferase [Candidatus Yanofskybacteria bacterium]